ncbi:MAG: DUF1801 domain-containing protein [Actinobacteria bacterium]|nr:MAG: DUF1801 domain-containing protein [Actinomycetota bacterium]
MASAENKTQPTDAAVVDYIQALPTERRREEGMELLRVFERVTGAPAVMWGPSIIGFGTHHYKYDSGREGDEPIVAFSPRKGAISLYGLYSAYVEPLESLQADLGAVTAGKGCVYAKRLDKVDMDNLERRIRNAWEREGRSCD